MADVLGFLEHLDNNRLVFVGRSDDRPGVVFLGFRRDGVDTRMAISEEAFMAMVRLYTQLTIADPTNRHPYPPSTQAWRHHWVVSDADHER
jgi:hypothetical protein